MPQSAIEPDELRRRAEAQMTCRDLPSKLDLDPIRLLHELQVHKIELEMQNEELIASNRELEVVRRRFEALYRLAPAGYLTLSDSGLVLEANDRAFEMLKRDGLGLLKQPFRNCLAPESVAAFDEMINAAQVDGNETCADNLLVHRPQTVPIYTKAQCRLVLIDERQGPVILLALMDVSTLKYAVDDVISNLLR